jgi:methionine-rich copper-binding protein CopC
MKSVQKYVFSMLFVANAMAGSSAAWAHAGLQTSIPEKDAEIAAGPKEITLQFNEKLESAFSTAKLVDSTGKQVNVEKSTLDAGNPSVMKLPVPALSPGKYKVEYVGVGHDGHRRKGDYSFTVK